MFKADSFSKIRKKTEVSYNKRTDTAAILNALFHIAITGN